MTISTATSADLDDWVRMAMALWPDPETDTNAMLTILNTILHAPNQAGFLVRDDQQVAVGFMNLSLRTDYVPGADRSPVAFVEGIYVRPPYQQQGIGRLLIARAEQWARDQGCDELASDVTLGNTAGETFHRQAGFDEVERVIQFIKKV